MTCQPKQSTIGSIGSKIDRSTRIPKMILVQAGRRNSPTTRKPGSSPIFTNGPSYSYMIGEYDFQSSPTVTSRAVRCRVLPDQISVTALLLAATRPLV